MKQLMQMMDKKPGNIFWDDYYNKINFKEDKKRSMSALRTILEQPTLGMAFWIVVVMLLCYIFFNGKRKQRIIPVIKPVENTSIAFTQAIAGLYMAENNNKNIADKMITYLNEHIRTRYFLSGQLINNNFISTLSKKSGVPFDAVESMYNAIQQVQLSEELSDFELLSLNEQIQEFYKKRI
jgi:predicted nucleic acid-binding protein